MASSSERTPRNRCARLDGDQEDAQSAVLQEYLPAGLSEDEVRAIVRKVIDSGVDQMGPLMGQVMPQIRGRFDGKEANRIVREELGS